MDPGTIEYLTVAGVRLELQRIGPEGGSLAPIVFLHEGLGSVAMWRDWPATVCNATGRAGIVYSRRGYGQSDAVPDVRGAGRLSPGYLHHEAFVVLPELLSTLKIQKPVLLGHSDGGSIALLYASRHPLAACIVMAPHVIVEDISVRSIEEAKQAFISDGLRERLKRFHADVDVAFWQWNDIWLSSDFRSFDIRAKCRNIEAPVLAIQGVDDPYGTARQIDEIAPTRGVFEKCMLAQCGHSPHRDQAEKTRERTAQFLAKLP